MKRTQRVSRINHQFSYRVDHCFEANDDSGWPINAQFLRSEQCSDGSQHVLLLQYKLLMLLDGLPDGELNVPWGSPCPSA